MTKVVYRKPSSQELEKRIRCIMIDLNIPTIAKLSEILGIEENNLGQKIKSKRKWSDDDKVNFCNKLNVRLEEIFFEIESNEMIGDEIGDAE